MKEAGTNHWNTSNTGATNSSGFTALPAGNKNNIGMLTGSYTEFWSSSLINTNLANSIWMFYNYNYTDSVLQTTFSPISNVQMGLSVRCLKD